MPALINIPQSPFLDKSGRISREWYLWLVNLGQGQPSPTDPLSIEQGGTGQSQVPAAGQLLIGTGGEALAVNYLTPTKDQTTIENGDGTITIGTVQDIGIDSSPTFKNLTITMTLTIAGDVVFSGNLEIDGNLSVLGDADFTKVLIGGPVDDGNPLQVNGAATVSDATAILKNATTMDDYASDGVSTLNNSPFTGDPRKWIGINDNGTMRYIPTW